MSSQRVQTAILVVWVSALVLLLVPYLDFSDGTFRVHVNFYSAADEAPLSERWSRDVERVTPRLDDPVLEAYVQQLGTKLVMSVGPTPFPYQFRILDAEDINAQALPGGIVYVNLGLLTHVQTEGELAGVLAHEIGHVVARHPTEKLSRHQLVSATVAFGGFMAMGGLAMPMATKLLTEVPALSFGRWEEQQADDMGLEYLYLAGYHPETMATFFDRLLSLSRESRLREFVSTHPLSAKRAKRVRRQYAKWAVSRRWITDADAFHVIKVLAGSQLHVSRGYRLYHQGQYEPARQELNRAIELNSDNAEAYYWRGLAHAKSGALDSARTDFEASIRLNPDTVKPYLPLNAVLAERGEWDTIIEHWNRYLASHPKDGQAYYERGGAYFGKGDVPRALDDAQQACDLGYEDGCAALERYGTLNPN